MTTLSPRTSRFVHRYDYNKVTLSFDSNSLKHLAATNLFSGFLSGFNGHLIISLIVGVVNSMRTDPTMEIMALLDGT
jgi:hypothetical protein